MVGVFLNIQTDFNPGNLVVVLDNSGSMEEHGLILEKKNISKLHAAKLFLNQFLKQSSLQGSIGIVTGSTKAFWNSPLTSDQFSLREIVGEIETMKIPGESETNLSDALVLAMNMFKTRPVGQNQILLITDGEHNVVKSSSGFSPFQVGALAEKLGVAVHVLDMGGEGMADSDLQKRKTAQENLQGLAAITGGNYQLFKNPVGDSELIRGEIKLSGNVAANISPWLPGFTWFFAGVFFLLAVLMPGAPWRRAV